MTWWWDRHRHVWLIGIGWQRMVARPSKPCSLCLWIGPYMIGVYRGKASESDWISAAEAYEREKQHGQ